MLEYKTYSYRELSDLLGTRDNEGIARRLERWGIRFDKKGKGANTTYSISAMTNPFKVYCILELDFSSATDFEKLAVFLYYLFNDDGFAGLPCEMMEAKLTADGHTLTRQTIGKYLRRLANKNLIDCQSRQYHYYFAKRGNLIDTTEEEYKQAWREYWTAIAEGNSARQAIFLMCNKYGGVARKQDVILLNGIYGTELDRLNDMVCAQIEELGNAC